MTKCKQKNEDDGEDIQKKSATFGREKQQKNKFFVVFSSANLCERFKILLQQKMLKVRERWKAIQDQG